MYTTNAFDSNSDSDPNHDNSNSDFYYSDIFFAKLVPEEYVVVVEPREDAGIMVNIGKVVVGTEQRLHMDKGSTV